MAPNSSHYPSWGFETRVAGEAPHPLRTFLITPHGDLKRRGNGRRRGGRTQLITPHGDLKRRGQPDE